MSNLTDSPTLSKPTPSASQVNTNFNGTNDLQLLLNSISDYSILKLDPEGYIQSWNRGTEFTQGYKADEIVGQHFSVFYTPEDINSGHPQEELRLAQKNGRYEEEGWRVRKNGTRYWVNVVITPLISEDGQLMGFSKVTRDLTERKNAEEALKKAYDELEAFSYSVSHDLRAPLRSMSGFSEVLQATIGDKLDERSRNYLNRIRESAQKMATLIDDLLNLSRLGRAPLNKKTVDISEIASSIIQDLRKSHPERQVEVSIAPNLIVQGDPNLLRIALENLLNNAWKYTSKVSQARIEFGVQRKHGLPVYFVKDNGAGFEMKYAEKLFGAFQRLHGANEFPGNGIGLATVKRIIHRHGGDVRAESKPNEGATFYFTLEA